jgi:hypothetical protein
VGNSCFEREAIVPLQAPWKFNPRDYFRDQAFTTSDAFSVLQGKSSTQLVKEGIYLDQKILDAPRFGNLGI